MQNYREQIIEVDTEGITEKIILEEVRVGIGIDNILIILEGMIKVMVDLDQV